MQKRRLGKTDLKLTTIGLGTWAMGGPWEFGWGPQDDGEAIGAIRAALDSGINWIDTAPAYGLGHSEELIARALKQTNHRPMIATKCGIVWNEKKQRITCLKKESIRSECHNSLRRLDVETIDLYQMHWPDPEEDFEDAWEEMLKLKDEGKVRYAGVCNFNVEQLERIRKDLPREIDGNGFISRGEQPVSLQPPYNMLRREVEAELLDYCAGHKMGVVTYSPMQRGLLTGKFSPQRLANLAPDDHRKRSPDFQEPRFSAALELVEHLKKIAARNGRTCAQLAVSWVLRRPEVTAAIVGARRPRQIIETAPASDWILSHEDIEEIEKLLDEYQAKIHPVR
jgi:aryl-alcohol dehydrogenase-like predicted oxidoreductase